MQGPQAVSKGPPCFGNQGGYLPRLITVMDMDRLCQLTTRAEDTPGTLWFSVRDTAREEAAHGL